MRTALVAFMGLVVSTSVVGCSLTQNPDGSVTIRTKTEFVSDARPNKEIAYTGQTIEILNDSPNPGLGLQFTVTGNPGATAVKAAAVISSQGDQGDTENAQKANAEALESFTVTEANGKITVRCGHSTKDYGTVSQASTGCKTLTVTVPAGDATKPINLVVKSGNADVTVTGVTGSVAVDGQGTASATVSATPVKGSVITVLADSDATLALPATFSADVVNLGADDPKTIDTSAFPELKAGSGYGTAGTGAASITVKSTGLLGSAKITKQ